MTQLAIQKLNDQFALPEQLQFVAGPTGLALVEMSTAYATAQVALQGAHVVQFQPRGQQPVLWVSSQSQYHVGRAIRGGIPLCWPWFGPHPGDPQLPAHGFVRTMPWIVLSTAVHADGSVELRLGLRDTAGTRHIWPHAFELQAIINLSHTLDFELLIHNSGATPFSCGGALHSYFGVSAIESITIEGLDATAYIDQLRPGKHYIQAGPITIADEVDRIYLDTAATCRLIDPGWQRRVVIEKAGSRSSVVWNPWIAKAQRLTDFAPAEYQAMVCIETANAGPDQVSVAPGAEHRLRVVLATEPNDQT